MRGWNSVGKEIEKKKEEEKWKVVLECNKII